MNQLLNDNSLYELSRLMTIEELLFFIKNMPEYANPNGSERLEKKLLSNEIWIPKIKEYMLIKQEDNESINKNAYKFIQENWKAIHKKYNFSETETQIKLLKNKDIICSIKGKSIKINHLIPIHRNIRDVFASLHYIAVYVDNPKGVFVNDTIHDPDYPQNDITCVMTEINELKGLELKYVHYSFDNLIFMTNNGMYMYEHSDGCGEIILTSHISSNSNESDNGKIIDIQLGDPNHMAHIISVGDETAVHFGPYMAPRNRMQYPQYIMKTKTKSYTGYVGKFPGTENNILIVPTTF